MSVVDDPNITPLDSDMIFDYCDYYSSGYMLIVFDDSH